MKVLLLLFLLLTISCSKKSHFQDSPQYVTSAERLAACGEFTPFLDVFKDEKISSVFTCLGWNQKYGHLEQAIKALPVDQWNNFTAAIHLQLTGSAKNSSAVNAQHLAKMREAWSKNALTQEEITQVGEVVARLLGLYAKREGRTQGYTAQESKYWVQWLGKNYKQLKDMMRIMGNAYNSSLVSDTNSLEYEPDWMKESTEHYLTELMKTFALQVQKNPKVLGEVSKVLKYEEEGAPWLTYLAQKFVGTNSSDYLPVLLLDKTSNPLLPEIPFLYNVIIQGLECPTLKFNSNLQLLPNFRKKLSTLPYVSRDVFILEVLDLQVKYLGVRELCGMNVGKGGGFENKFQRLGSTMYDLSELLLVPNAVEAMQYFQRALRQVDTDPEMLLQFFSSPIVQSMYSDFGLLLQKAPKLSEFYTNFFSHLSPEDWKELTVLLSSNAFWSMWQDLIAENKMEEFFHLIWPSLSASWSHPKAFRLEPWFESVLSSDVLTEFVKNNSSDLQDFSLMGKVILEDPVVLAELQEFFKAGEWWTLLKLIVQEGDVKVVEKKNNAATIPVSNELKEANTAYGEDCLQQLVSLRLMSVQELIFQMPTSCKNFSGRASEDFPWLVMRDVSRLSEVSFNLNQKNLFASWGLLRSDVLSMLSDLFLLGRSYATTVSKEGKLTSGFELFWNDLNQVFFHPAFTDLLPTIFKHVGPIPLKMKNDLAVHEYVSTAANFLQVMRGQKLLKEWNNTTTPMLSVDMELDKKSFDEIDVEKLVDLFSAMNKDARLEKFERLLSLASMRSGYFGVYFLNEMDGRHLGHSYTKFSRLLETLLSQYTIAKRVYGFTDAEKPILSEIKSLLPLLRSFNPQEEKTLLSLVKFLRASSKASSREFKWLFGINENAPKGHLGLVLIQLAQSKLLTKVGSLFEKLQYSNILIKQIQKIKDQILEFKWKREIPSMTLDHLEKYKVFEEEKTQKALQRIAKALKEASPRWGALAESFQGNSLQELINVALLPSTKDQRKLAIQDFWVYYYSNYKQPMIDFAEQVETVFTKEAM